MTSPFRDDEARAVLHGDAGLRRLTDAHREALKIYSGNHFHLIQQRLWETPEAQEFGLVEREFVDRIVRTLDDAFSLLEGPGEDVLVVASAVIVVLFGNDVITSAALSVVVAVASASSLLLTAEKWNEAALRDESMRSVLRLLSDLQLEIDEARWRIAADRRPESVELTMERLRRDYEHAMKAEAADPSVA